MYEWRQIEGSDLKLRSEIIARIEAQRAFWLLPQEEDRLYMFGDKDAVIVRELGGGILEWMLSRDEHTNECALKAWKTIEGFDEAEEFFSVIENPNWESLLLGKEAIGMAEAEPNENPMEMEEDHVMAVLLLVKRSLWPKQKKHPGYPPAMKAWTYGFPEES